MTAIAMNVLLHQLQEIVPAFNVASVPKDATGAYASPVHIIAGLIDKTPTYIQKIINDICSNVNANCTKLKVIVYGTKQRNKIMVGDAESILRILGSCNRPDMAAIVAKLPIVVPVPQAPFVAPTPQALFVAPTPQAPFVAEAPQVPVASAPQAPFVAEEPQVPVEPEPAHLQQIKKPLVLNGMVIEVDPVTSMVNATQMCQAGGKLFGDYYRQKSTEEFLQTLSLAMGIHIAELTNCKNGSHSGTMVHFQVALHVAYWLSSEVQVQFSKWIGELLLTGRVELGKEKTPEELDAIWKSRIAEEQAKIQADYLRKKLSKELLAIDEDIAAKRAKRQREDVAADEERAAKRQRDDAAAAVAVEEETKDRAAKRQREDAAADVKAKEDSRMQLVRFDAEMAAKAIATTEDLKLKRLKVQDRQSNCAKSLIDLKANFIPKLTSCLELSLPTNAHLRSAINDIEVNLSRKINKLITGDDIESSGYQETQYCNDFQTFLREMGRPIATTSELSALGRFVSKKYQKANNDNKPEKIMKTVNGANCQVNTYKIEHKDFIEKSIKEFYEKSTIESTQPLLGNRAPKAPTNNISRYFR